MKQHPILFSTPMIQAILEGRKTMTRRIIKPQPIDNTEEDGNFFEGNHKGYVKVDGHPYWKDQFVHEFSKKQVGDILWVRESFAYTQFGFDKGLVGKGEIGVIDSIIFKADKGNDDWDGSWKPSIHMPKEACRLYLEITGIRVERLQDIEGYTAYESPVLAEGIMKFHHGDGVYGYHWKEDMGGKNFIHPEDAFKDLWQSINGPESWEANPWVWVIEFKKIEKPN